MPDEITIGQDVKRLRQWEAWDKFLEARMNTGFNQTSWWASFKSSRGRWGNFGAVLRDGETVVGGAVVWTWPFAPGKWVYYIPEGPVFLENESSAEQEQVFQAVMAFIDKKRKTEQQVVSHLAIEPRWESVPSFVRGFEKYDDFFYLPRATLCIDLSLPESAILAQMKQKGRYNIGLARRYGVSIVEDVSSRGIQDFLKLYEATYSRKDLKAHDSSYFHALIPMLSDLGHGSVFFAEYQGVRIATALVVYFGNMATYLYGASLDTHRNVMAPYLLQFEIMCKAKALGFQRYDMFGITPKNEPRDAWTDISNFKRKFGGQEVCFVPTLNYIYDLVAYEEWKVMQDQEEKEEEGDSDGGGA